jgi:hypothetical protein
VRLRSLNERGPRCERTSARNVRPSAWQGSTLRGSSPGLSRKPVFEKGPPGAFEEGRLFGAALFVAKTLRKDVFTTQRLVALPCCMLQFTGETGLNFGLGSGPSCLSSRFLQLSSLALLLEAGWRSSLCEKGACRDFSFEGLKEKRSFVRPPQTGNAGLPVSAALLAAGLAFVPVVFYPPAMPRDGAPDPVRPSLGGICTSSASPAAGAAATP